ncbi:MAG TPA: translesion DNA synthesis-associated protein ImuA [Casimicrobiaceae bacterium]|nr:translesion DNA synthesis-associated protein ImuA [Casimicrobiaceae bacterium]
MKPAVAQLLHHPLLWRGDAKARVERTVASGFAELDRELPGGGWPQGSLTELLVDNEGIGELRLLLPALEKLSRAGRWLALVAPPHLPYAPAFARAGVDPARLVIIDAEESNRWWAAEQVLRSDSAGALLFWPQSINDARLRRLAVATQDTASIAFLFAGGERAGLPSPAPLRIRLSIAGGELRLDVFKRRGGVCGKPLRIDVASAMRERVDGDASLSRMEPRGPSTVRRSGPRSLSPSFNRPYPVGMPSARVWNRALVRADEGRRVPGPDPRGSSSRVAGAEAKPKPGAPPRFIPGIRFAQPRLRE